MNSEMHCDDDDDCVDETSCITCMKLCRKTQTFEADSAVASFYISISLFREKNGRLQFVCMYQRAA